MAIWFYSKSLEYGWLSNFSEHGFVLDGVRWPSVEHYYQAQKSSDPDYRAAIRAASSPGTAKRLAAPPGASRRVGRQSWFRAHGALPRAGERRHAVIIMVASRRKGESQWQSSRPYAGRSTWATWARP